MTQPGLLRHFVERLRGREEGEVFLAGLALTALFVVQLVLLAVLVPDAGMALLKAVPFDAFGGKESSLPIAIQGGAPWWLAAEVSALQHLALGTLVFPVFLFLLHRHHDRDNLLMRRLRRIEAAADRHRAFVTRWGPLGVFLFMMVPFLVNGPLVGSILGRMAGIRSRYLALPVFAATIVSSLAWAYAYDRLFAFVESLDDRLPVLLTALIVGTFLGIALVAEWRERRRERALADRKPAGPGPQA